MAKSWYEELFENSAAAYDREPFVQGTPGEVDFIEQEIGCDRSCRILDVGCGTGRHAIELARRGYSVVGVDLSPAQIRAARRKAQLADVQVEFVVGDARKLTFEGTFDLAMIICEGAFSLMETDEQDYQILCGVQRALKEHGKFILTTLNALYPLTHEQEENYRFDLRTFRSHFVMEGVDDDNNKRAIVGHERYYAPPEITWRLKTLGFDRVELFGCKLGRFSREHELCSEDLEMLVVAQK